MNTRTTIQVRIDAKTKKAAGKMLKEMGLDFSSACNLFLKNVVITESMPLNLYTKNGYTMAEEREIIRDADDAEMFGKRYTDIDLLLKEI